MKLLKGVFAVIIIACLLFIFLVGMMFEVDTVTLREAVRMVLVYLGIMVVALMCYISIDTRERRGLR